MFELSEQAKEAIAKADEERKKLAIQQRMRTIPAPTNDKEVKRQLRAHGAPICYFGEGPAERRDRLCEILAYIELEGAPPPSAQPELPPSLEDQKEIFYTEGPPHLRSARVFIASYSLHRAATRLASEREKKEEYDKRYSLVIEAGKLGKKVTEYAMAQGQELTEIAVEREIRETEAAKNSLRQFSSQTSQMGDERPVSACAFAAGGGGGGGEQVLATASWNGRVRIWNIPGCGLRADLVGHSDRVTGLAWRPNFHAMAGAEGQEEEEEEESNNNKMSDENNNNNNNNETNDSNNEENKEGREAAAQGAAAAAFSNKNTLSRKRKSTSSTSNGIASGVGSSVAVLASGSADCTVKLWNVASKSCVSTLQGHSDRVARVAFHPSGRFIASASYDQSWRLWDVEGEREVLLQEGHSRPVYAVALQKDGALAATGGMDCGVRVWDLRTGRNIVSLSSHVKMVMDLDWRQNGFHLASCSDDHSIKIWDLRQQSLLYTIPAHASLISCVKYSDNGRFILSGSYDHTVKIFDASSFDVVKVLAGHEDKVMGVAWGGGAGGGGGEEYIASCAYDRTWKLWAAGV